MFCYVFNLHDLGRSHRPLLGYNLTSSIVQLELYCSVLPAEKQNYLSEPYFSSKSLIKVIKEVGGSVAAVLYYYKAGDSPLHFCHMQRFHHLLYKTHLN